MPSQQKQYRKTFGVQLPNPAKGNQLHVSGHSTWSSSLTHRIALKSRNHTMTSTSSDLWFRQIASGMRYYYGVVERAKQHQKLLCVIGGKFADMYWEFRLKIVKHVLGPFDVYETRWTLMRYASIRPTAVDWSRYQQRYGVDALIKLCMDIDVIPNYHAKIKAQGSVHKFLKQLDVPTHKLLLRAPDDYCRRYLSSIISFYCSCVAKTRPYLGMYIQKITNIVKCPPRPCKGTIMNIQKYCKQFCFDDCYEQLHQSFQTIACAGLDMVRLPTSFNFRLPTHPHENLNSAKRSIWNWMSCLSHINDDHVAVHAVSHANLCTQWLWKTTTNKCGYLSNDRTLCGPNQAYDFVECISQTDQNLVITCEDKDNNVLWAQMGLL